MHRWKILGTAAAAMAASYAHGSFYGWIGIVRELPGRYAWLDVYAGMSIPSERLISVFDANIVANQCTFVQGNTVTTSRWRPALGESGWSDTDSFVTLGGFSSGGNWYCGDGTSGDATFTNYATPGATTIAPDAGWFGADPFSPQVLAVPMSSFLTSGATLAAGSANANFGVWVAHFYIDQGALANQGSVTFDAWVNFGSIVHDFRTFSWIPAPGGIAVLALAPLASRGRRR